MNNMADNNMTLSDFKKLHKKFTRSGITFQELYDNPEYDLYLELRSEIKEFNDWCLKQYIKAAKINYRKYCCLNMAYRLIEDKMEKEKVKTDRDYINYDAVMHYSKSHKIFGIPIHDGGSSFIPIKYCPWCGSDISKGLKK